MKKTAILILFCALWVLCGSGCSNQFPQSQVFQQIDVRAILLKNSPKNSQPNLNYSINISPEYAIKNYWTILILGEDGQKNFLQEVMTECTNKVTKLGGRIVGEGETSDLSRQDVMFDTSKTTGQIILFSSGINQTNLQVIAIVFECRKK